MATQQQFRAPAGFRLRSGQEWHPEAFLVYETFGTLNADASNAILWPTCYGQRSDDQRRWIGEGLRFDPSRYFIVTVNMLGNGMSYSPTTVDIGQAYPRDPVTYADNVALQEALMLELGIQRWALIYGFSMGAMLALQWAVQSPSRVAAVVGVCGSARCNPANAYFLGTLQEALVGDPTCNLDEEGRILSFHGRPREGLRRFALIYADWIFDEPSSKAGASPNASRPEFARCQPGGCAYRDQLYHERMPGATEEAFLEARVDDYENNWDALEYYAVLRTWLAGDVAAEHDGDLGKALGRITALVHLLPGSTDQYFKAEEIRQDAAQIRNCVFHPLVSAFGHAAEGRPECQPQIQNAISACLDAV